MKVMVTTSNAYSHILPIFFYLYGKYWADPMTLIGYKKPDIDLPDYCEWISLGPQTDKQNFAYDMQCAFFEQRDPFIWLFEDTFIKQPIDRDNLNRCIELSKDKAVGRVSLTNNSYKFYEIGQYKDFFMKNVYMTPQDSDYRLSLQPAIWNPGYLHKHLKIGFDPWSFENQGGTLTTFKEDEYINVALAKHDAPLTSNEGVRRFDLHRYDFTGLVEEDIIHLKKMGYEHSPWTR